MASSSRPTYSSRRLSRRVVAWTGLRSRASSPWGLRIGHDRPDDLGRLHCDGLGNVLADRLADPLRPPQVKRLLIAVAAATEALGAVDAATELVRDRETDEDLRHDALWFVVRFGGNSHLNQLIERLGPPDSPASEGALRCLAIQALLDRGLWPIWKAALEAPPRE